MSDRRSVPHPGIPRTTNWRRSRDILSSLQRMLHVGSSAEIENILSQTGYDTVISFQQGNASQLPTTSDHCPLDVEQGCDTDPRSLRTKVAPYYICPTRSYQFCGDLSRDLRAVSEDNSITFRDIGKVLTLLNYHVPVIPRDPRTLFGTTRVYPPFVVGVLCGNGKPKPLDGYLRDTIDELNALLPDDVFLPRWPIHCAVRLCSIVCDTPARCCVKCIRNFCAYYGCDKCTDRSVGIGGHVRILSLDANGRSGSSIHNRLQIDHHNRDTSPFESLPVGMLLHFSTE
ncbi:hypothetical protein EG68_09167 [Paragonimus skrjabini miyazakii]|uniref:Uncharacterized protein n=1 Tax=Paragonimus skrjabini miyazakii TaxID=59628 RepID=A0A8S9YHC5_9TREM|nr:hypothetical protein EG68_09167 [Paragonimus skrjabini miyazakii]